MMVDIIMVDRLSATAAMAIRMMNEEKLFGLLKAILRTINNSRFKPLCFEQIYSLKHEEK